MKMTLSIAAYLITEVLSQGAFAKTLSGDYTVKACATHLVEQNNQWEIDAGFAVSHMIEVASPVTPGTLVHVEALDKGLWVSAISIDGSAWFTDTIVGVGSVRGRSLSQFLPVQNHVNKGHFFADAHFNADKTAFSSAITIIRFDGSDEEAVKEKNVLEVTAQGAKGFVGDQFCELIRR